MSSISSGEGAKSNHGQKGQSQGKLQGAVKQQNALVWISHCPG